MKKYSKDAFELLSNMELFEIKAGGPDDPEDPEDEKEVCIICTTCVGCTSTCMVCTNKVSDILPIPE